MTSISLLFPQLNKPSFLAYSCFQLSIISCSIRDCATLTPSGLRKRDSIPATLTETMQSCVESKLQLNHKSGEKAGARGALKATSPLIVG